MAGVQIDVLPAFTIESQLGLWGFDLSEEASSRLTERLPSFPLVWSEIKNDFDSRRVKAKAFLALIPGVIGLLMLVGEIIYIVTQHPSLLVSSILIPIPMLCIILPMLALIPISAKSAEALNHLDLFLHQINTRPEIRAAGFKFTLRIVRRQGTRIIIEVT
eukprot:TRINITY_DN15906_c0_g1_i1.p1 TRINITY_DN15906_c0_g1~~TRINITY_DN15906_c0_g1_i1.p1  ORF type:complete len:161 (-),score=20.60 TRINITY_DN15906_c0_g1_i1:337-819(-)